MRTDWAECINEKFGKSQSPTILECMTTQDKPISLSIFEILYKYQNLEKLKLKGCYVNIGTCQPDNHHEGTLGQPLLSFSNLTQLDVSDCNGCHLLDSSIVKSLAQLKEMSIMRCVEMKDIIIRDCKEGETTEEDEAIDFKSLEILVLRDLPTLVSFYSGNNDMMFPRLRKLFVSKCPKMKSFTGGIIITTLMLSRVITEIQDEYLWERFFNLEQFTVRERWDGDVNTTIRKLYEESSDSLFQQSSADTVC